MPLRLVTSPHKREYDLLTFQKVSSVGKINFQRWKLYFPPLEILFSTVGNFLFLRRNRKVPPLELKSSKRGTIFGTRIYKEISTIQRDQTTTLPHNAPQARISERAGL